MRPWHKCSVENHCISVFLVLDLETKNSMYIKSVVLNQRVATPLCREFLLVCCQLIPKLNFKLLTHVIWHFLVWIFKICRQFFILKICCLKRLKTTEWSRFFWGKWIRFYNERLRYKFFFYINSSEYALNFQMTLQRLKALGLFHIKKLTRV